MDNGYIVRFIRKDDKPVEEFFYHTFEDATSHLLLFRDDDSDLYARIESGLWFHKPLTLCAYKGMWFVLDNIWSMLLDQKSENA